MKYYFITQILIQPASLCLLEALASSFKVHALPYSHYMFGEKALQTSLDRPLLIICDREKIAVVNKCLSM